MQVVFVRYAPVYDGRVEWVYNGADIDQQKLIWARDLGPEQDKQLLNYYPGRTFWLVNAESPDAEPILYRP